MAAVDSIDAAPPVDPQLQADLLAWADALAEYQAELTKIKQMAAGLKTHTTDMFQIIQIMHVMMSPSESQVKSNSDLLNLDTDLRNTINSGQSGYNGVGSDPNNNIDFPDKQGLADAQAMITAMNQLMAGLDLLHKSGAIDDATYGTIQTAVGSLEGAFGTNWGNPALVWGEIKSWVTQSAGGGTNPPGVKTVNDAFQTLTSSVSALSTTANTQLSFVTEQLKQIMGSFQSSIQSAQKLTLAMIQNEKTS